MEIDRGAFTARSYFKGFYDGVTLYTVFHKKHPLILLAIS